MVSQKPLATSGEGLFDYMRTVIFNSEVAARKGASSATKREPLPLHVQADALAVIPDRLRRFLWGLVGKVTTAREDQFARL